MEKVKPGDVYFVERTGQVIMVVTNYNGEYGNVILKVRSTTERKSTFSFGGWHGDLNTPLKYNGAVFLFNLGEMIPDYSEILKMVHKEID